MITTADLGTKLLPLQYATKRGYVSKMSRSAVGNVGHSRSRYAYFGMHPRWRAAEMRKWCRA